jgi:peptidoglycan/xylan/chitin deacetylase (PgdA/CDA1 family)
MNVKQLSLHVSKRLGLFYLARLLSPPGLRILCYHGFAMDDEADFRPKLFISPKTFERRLRFLSAKRFPVLDLQDAIVKLSAGTLPEGATVITIDDGFYSVLHCALPLLQSLSFPATVYITTYYCRKETPIFRLMLQYIFWKTRDSELDLSDLPAPLTGRVRLTDQQESGRVMWDLIRFGETQVPEPERVKLAEMIAGRLHVDYKKLFEGRHLSLMNESELKELVSADIDIQLHTHRHQLPPGQKSIIQQEITDNRAVLEPIARKPLRHLCYPSGIWSEQSWPYLTDMQVTSATTCDPGLNIAATPALGLKRFLDGENISQIEFESEMCGFNDFLRRIRSFVRD